jgi:hypothetical protein
MLIAGLVLPVPLLRAAVQQPSAQSPPPAADEAALAAGVRQVDEGDFEAAIATLQPIADRLVAARAKQAARACLYLGIAQLAVDQRDAARRRFREALDAQPDLRLGADRFSPKVIGAFEEARRERDAARRTGTATAGKAARSSKTRTLLLAGGGVAVGVTAAVLAGRGSGSPTASLRFSGARFSPSAVTCPDGSEDVPLPVNIDVDAANGGSETVRITAVTSRLVITSSPAQPNEVSFASSAETNYSPPSLAAGTVTLHVATTLNCGNGAGDPPRFNVWQATLSIATSSGTFTATTPVDGLQVNIP